MSVLVRRGRRLGNAIIIGGDWNAEVASACMKERFSPTGYYGNSVSNARGAWLQSWAGLHRSILANTLFKKRWGRRWTHTVNGRQRMIDYFLVESRHASEIIDAGVCKSLNMGSDHRAI
eukprot:592682-Karenia_brevis.AAC.1